MKMCAVTHNWLAIVIVHFWVANVQLCAIVNNCAILGVKSSIGHLLCAIMCNCTTVHLCRSGGKLCIYVCDDVCPQCTSGGATRIKTDINLTAPDLLSSSCKQLVLHCRAQINIASWYKWWGDIHKYKNKKSLYHKPDIWSREGGNPFQEPEVLEPSFHRTLARLLACKYKYSYLYG